MTLNELLTTLSHGSLSNLRVGGDGTGQIPTEHEAKVIGFVNQALLALFTRFVLSEKEVVVRAQDDVINYPLKQANADNDSNTTSLKYIQDTVADPFKGDVIKISTVFDEGGVELNINRKSDVNSLYSPSPKVLQIPKPVTGNVYYVYYQASHAKLSSADLDQEVEIPVPLEEALEAYVAYKTLSPMNGPEHSAKAIEHFQRYEMICEAVEKNDLVGSSIVTSYLDKFEERGFA
jgi:hypothetical protein